MISRGSLAISTRGGRTRLGRDGSGISSAGAGALKRVSTNSNPESAGSVSAIAGSGCGVLTDSAGLPAIGVDTTGASSKRDAVVT